MICLTRYKISVFLCLKRSTQQPETMNCFGVSERDLTVSSKMKPIPDTPNSLAMFPEPMFSVP